MRKRKVTSLLLTLIAPLGLLVLGVIQGYAGSSGGGLSCSTSPSGCLVCYGVVNGQCCGIVDCGSGPQGGCGACGYARADKAQPQMLLARLLERDPAVANAMKD